MMKKILILIMFISLGQTFAQDPKLKFQGFEADYLTFADEIKLGYFDFKINVDQAPYHFEITGQVNAGPSTVDLPYLKEDIVVVVGYYDSPWKNDVSSSEVRQFLIDSLVILLEDEPTKIRDMKIKILSPWASDPGVVSELAKLPDFKTEYLAIPGAERAEYEEDAIFNASLDPWSKELKKLEMLDKKDELRKKKQDSIAIVKHKADSVLALKQAQERKKQQELMKQKKAEELEKRKIAEREAAEREAAELARKKAAEKKKVVKKKRVVKKKVPVEDEYEDEYEEEVAPVRKVVKKKRIVRKKVPVEEEDYYVEDEEEVVSANNAIAKKKAASSAAPRNSKEINKKKQKKIWGFVSLGVGVIGGIVGAIEHNNSIKAKKAISNWEAMAVYQPAYYDAAAHQAEIDAKKKHELNRNISFAVGGIAIVGGIVLLTF